MEGFSTNTDILERLGQEAGLIIGAIGALLAVIAILAANLRDRQWKLRLIINCLALLLGLATIGITALYFHDSDYLPEETMPSAPDTIVTEPVVSTHPTMDTEESSSADPRVTLEAYSAYGLQMKGSFDLSEGWSDIRLHSASVHSITSESNRTHLPEALEEVTVEEQDFSFVLKEDMPAGGYVFTLIFHAERYTLTIEILFDIHENQICGEEFIEIYEDYKTSKFTGNGFLPPEGFTNRDSVLFW